MNIRIANIKDIDLLIKVRFDYLMADFGNITEWEEKVMRSQLLNYYKKNIGDSFIAILAEIDNEIVSVAFLVITEKPVNPLFITGKTGILLNVFTYPKYRRKGIALKVISRIIEEAKKRGLSLIELSSTSAGKQLYENYGFRELKSKYTKMKLQLN